MNHRLRNEHLQQNEIVVDIFKLFDRQVEFQRQLTKLTNLPNDNPVLFANSVLLLIEEIGEVLKEDKRWKGNFRSNKYSPKDKLEEMVDMFITMMNTMIFSGVTMPEMLEAIKAKQATNFIRLAGE